MSKPGLENLVSRLAKLVVRHTSDKISEAAQEDLVHELAALYLESPALPRATVKGEGNRIIVSAVGKNHPGIVAAISQVLARHGADIVDINQTLVQDNFAMIMVVDLGEQKASFASLKESLQAVAKELGIEVFAQHEDIFRSMQRI